ncbi:MAG: hypothetical protein M1820_008508 [Bogoriella megaspora]|nr:MAG: hypothetical protein M1820_008508 [Bogoriella megaspora]
MAKLTLLEDLAEQISDSTKIVSEHLKVNSLPQPSFELDAPIQWPELPPDVYEARSTLREASKKLHDLATGHQNLLWLFCSSWTNFAALQWISHYKVADAIPVDKFVSYAEIAKTTNLDESLLRRFLRLLMTNDVFCEPRPGVVAHTAQSTMLVSTHPMYYYVNWNTDDVGRWGSYVMQAWEKWGAEAGSVLRGPDGPD